MGHGQREAGRDGCIDGVAATTKCVVTCKRGEGMLARNCVSVCEGDSAEDHESVKFSFPIRMLGGTVERTYITGD